MDRKPWLGKMTDPRTIVTNNLVVMFAENGRRIRYSDVIERCVYAAQYVEQYCRMRLEIISYCRNFLHLERK